MNLLENVDSFAGKKIAVIGDLMLDRYIEGDVLRISPEAPVPVVHIKNQRYVPGGACNTANNIASLGGVPYLIGLVGDDPARNLLLGELKSRNINSDGIVEVNDRPTIEKTRIVGKNQHMLRMDSERIDKISPETEARILENVKSVAGSCDVLVLSDYGKGVVTQGLVNGLVDISSDAGKKLIVDPKPKSRVKYARAYLVTPNARESSELSGIEGSDTPSIEKIGKHLVKELNSNILITRGENGMSVFGLNDELSHIPTRAQTVYDVSGAGDTVVGTMALGIASGLQIEDAAQIANHAAGIVVSKFGTATVTPSELKSDLRWEIHDYLKESINVKQAVIERQMDKIEEIAQHIIDTYKNKKKILIFGNGGSAADAQHFAAELVGRFKRERVGLPAIALTTDSSILTSVGNDYGYDRVFERQLEALGSEGDLVVGISTSGNSENVVRAMNLAKKNGMRLVGMTGEDGGKLAEIADTMIAVPSKNVPRIQEAHISIIHIVCELLENQMFSDGA